ncbi:MAG: adenylate/guanylate cyclase domain-containing protein [Gemmatimonadota bacterium]
MWSRLSPRARRNTLRIIPFGVLWFLVDQVFTVSDRASAASAGIPSTVIDVDVGIYLFASFAVASVGCLVGAIELLYLNRRLAALSLGSKLVAKTAFYALLLLVVILVTFPVAAAMEMNTGLADRRVWERLGGFLTSGAGLSTGVQLAASLVVSLFYAEISEHIGPRVLTNLLIGRYHTPSEERRIFLFSDMKSSTRIAERLGHARYFELLRAYYNALGDAIVEHEGEVYQHIGDEIVVSWPEKVGLADSNCIRCVRRMKSDLRRQSASFERHFGVVPDFRAGMQAGVVTTGQIGALKKEIVFTGDVLNQTARIQGQCKVHGEDVLVGDELGAGLGDADEWAFRSLGDHALRGKDQSVELFALDFQDGPGQPPLR